MKLMESRENVGVKIRPFVHCAVTLDFPRKIFLQNSNFRIKVLEYVWHSINSLITGVKQSDFAPKLVFFRSVH